MKNQPHQKPKTNIMWRKYKGTTPEELCAAIRELWVANRISSAIEVSRFITTGGAGDDD